MHKLLNDQFAFHPDVQLMYIHTVWEGYASNTFESGLADLEDYDLWGWYAFDPASSTAPSATMDMFDTGGTPYTVIINKAGQVVESDFTKNEYLLRPIIEASIAEPWP